MLKRNCVISKDECCTHFAIVLCDNARLIIYKKSHLFFHRFGALSFLRGCNHKIRLCHVLEEPAIVKRMVHRFVICVLYCFCFSFTKCFSSSFFLKLLRLMSH